MSDPNTSGTASATWSGSEIEPLRFLPTSFMDGLKNAHWPGRCQTVPDSKLGAMTWFLDGAHTQESLACCLEWFVSPAVGLPMYACYLHWFQCHPVDIRFQFPRF